MEKLTLELPAMYGDHHVTEVRQVLGAAPGVAPEKVYASAAWQRVELAYDPGQTSPEAIRQALLARGYAIGKDTDLPPVAARRHTLTEFAVGPGAVEQFVERVAWGAPMGPCPGFEVRQPAAGGTHPADN